MKNFMISAYKHVGKTTLVKKLIENTNKNVFGFFTCKAEHLATEDGMCPVYIYPIGQEPVYDAEHLIGYCGGGHHYTNPEVFDRLGIKYLEDLTENPLAIIDEIGFLEADAKAFQARVFELLDSNIPVLLSIKQRQDVDFINRLKAYPDKDFIEFDENNRDEIYEYIQHQLEML